MKNIIVLLVGLTICSCNNSNNKTVISESANCDDSIASAQKIEYVECNSDSVIKMLSTELSEDEKYNDAILYGFWFKPHEAIDVNIFFHKDNTFQMHDYYVNQQDKVVNIYLEGTFEIKKDSIYLHSRDGKEIALRYWSANADNKEIDFDDKQKYITSDDGNEEYKYWLVKGGF